jgi:hypothetical protein
LRRLALAAALLAGGCIDLDQLLKPLPDGAALTDGSAPTDGARPDLASAASDGATPPDLAVPSTFALVQTGSVVVSSTGALSLSLQKPSTKGNLVGIAYVVCSTSALGAFIDEVPENVSCGGCTLHLSYAANNGGGISGLAITPSPDGPCAGVMFEMSGLSAQPLDQHNSSTASAATGLSLSIQATAASQELVLALFCESISSVGAVSLAAGAGWTPIADDGSSGLGVHFALTYEVVSAPLAFSATESSFTSGTWGGMAASFH